MPDLRMSYPNHLWQQSSRAATVDIVGLANVNASMVFSVSVTATLRTVAAAQVGGLHARTIDREASHDEVRDLHPAPRIGIARTHGFWIGAAETWHLTNQRLVALPEPPGAAYKANPLRMSCINDLL